MTLTKVFESVFSIDMCIFQLIYDYSVNEITKNAFIKLSCECERSNTFTSFILINIVIDVFIILSE